MDHWRVITSYCETTMRIHRSEWGRSFSMQACTEGDKLSLMRVAEPKREAGRHGRISTESLRDTQAGCAGSEAGSESDQVSRGICTQ